LRDYELVGPTKLFVLLVHDINAVGQIAAFCSGTIMSLVVIGGTLFYLLLLSAKGFLLTICVMTISLVITFAKQKVNLRRIRYILELQNKFFGRINSMLDGIKEMKIDSKVNKELYDMHLEPCMEEVARERTGNNIFQSRFSLLGHFIFFVTMGLVLYLFPAIGVEVAENPAQFVIVLLYILGPIQALVPLIPQFSHIKVVMERIEEVKEKLQEEEANPMDDQTFNEFSNIKLRNISYYYKTGHNETEFKLGPVDLTIHAGDLIFIKGGNGSGKSTLVKLLTGLYTASSGTIQLDEEPIGGANLQQYRNMFGVIFTDNHLFEYVYGVKEVADTQAKALLKTAGLQDKVTLSGNRFSTIELSEGQKKRLALIGLLLRDKPVYVLDEWAANQDPEFKDFFYRSLIPELSRRQKTIIVITHDERYLHLGQRLFMMENGLLQEIPAPVNRTSESAMPKL
ncbi:MAG TPA: cyclic peptide export ABC transporter, partial [Niastella sp.]|nr:cyclic peptide export ABC transporter [Niastella sp.]